MSGRDELVRRQYEDLPYPTRDPAEETRRLVATETGNLDSANHHVFGGEWTPDRPIRILVAGGGTGDATIYMARQLASSGRDGEVIQVDISAASLSIAAARAKVRGLTNARFVQASLLDLERLGLGRFDLINCAGVLHHLEDPVAGLRALRAVLADGGGIGLMLYAPYGRSGIYEVQAMLRDIAPPTMPTAERLAVTRRLLAALPPGNLLRRVPAVVHPDDDAEIHDLFLHARDQPFDVPRLMALLVSAGMRPIGLLPTAHYRARNWITDPELLDRVERLPTGARMAFVERYCGQIDRHVLFAVVGDNPVRPPRVDDPGLVPVLGFGPPDREDGPEGPRFGVATRLGRVALPPEPAFAPILAAIDGRRSSAEVAAASGLEPERFRTAYAALVYHLAGLNRLFLVRHPLEAGRGGTGASTPDGPISDIGESGC